MSGADDLYNETIIKAAKADRAAGRLDHPAGSATCNNPLCGDRVTIDVAPDAADGRIIAQKTRGCLLTRAAAAIVAGHEPLPSAADSASQYDAVRAWLRGESDAPPWPELAMFEPVRGIKSRHDCVLIAFEALRDACAEAAGKAADKPA